MNCKALIFGIIVFTFVVFIGSCRNAGLWLVKEDKVVHADAIVILIGSVADRVLQAVDLYNQKLSSKIIFSKVSTDAYKELETKGFHLSSTTENVSDALIALGIPSESILILPGNVLSTQEEAITFRNFLKTKPNIDTLLLVSSSTHTRRSSMIFKSAFRKSGIPAHIICVPSKYSRFNAEKWWKSKDDVQTVLIEYFKIANFLLIEKSKLD